MISKKYHFSTLPNLTFNKLLKEYPKESFRYTMKFELFNAPRNMYRPGQNFSQTTGMLLPKELINKP